MRVDHDPCITVCYGLQCMQNCRNFPRRGQGLVQAWPRLGREAAHSPYRRAIPSHMEASLGFCSSAVGTKQFRNVVALKELTTAVNNGCTV
jgi:hypothetical protein